LSKTQRVLRTNPAQRRRPPCGKQSRKFFHSFFSAPLPFLFFPLRKKNFLLCPSADAEYAAASHPDPDRAFGAEEQAGKNSFPQTPFLFARLLGLRPEIFCG